MLNPVAPYGYLFPIVYLFMADIANPDLIVCGCRTWIHLDITHFYEEHRQPSSSLHGGLVQKNGKSGTPLLGAGGFDTIYTAKFVTAVTAPPLIPLFQSLGITSFVHIYLKRSVKTLPAKCMSVLSRCCQIQVPFRTSFDV